MEIYRIKPFDIEIEDHNENSQNGFIEIETYDACSIQFDYLIEYKVDEDTDVNCITVYDRKLYCSNINYFDKNGDLQELHISDLKILEKEIKDNYIPETF